MRWLYQRYYASTHTWHVGLMVGTRRGGVDVLLARALWKGVNYGTHPHKWCGH